MAEGEIKFELAKDPAFVQLTTGFGEMQKMFKGMVEIVRAQGTALAEIRNQTAGQKPNGGVQSTGTGDDLDDGDEPDLDTMSQKDFASFLMKQVGSLLDEKLGDVGKKVDSLAVDARRKDLTAEYNQLKTSHKDLDDWDAELRDLSQKHPNLSIRQLYTLARDGNPDKSKQLDEKYKSADAGKKPDESLTLFGGYRPSTKTTEGSEGKHEKLTTTQALEKGWEDAVAKFPALTKMEDGLD